MRTVVTVCRMLWLFRIRPIWWRWRSACAVAPRVTVLEVTLATVVRPPLNCYSFCRRGVGIAWFEAWRSPETPLAPVAPRRPWMPAVVVLVLLAAWLALLYAGPATDVSLAALPVVVFNNSTGSDTAASGAGPATAVSGTAAAHTGGISSTTITLTNTPNLSAVLADGSAAVWLDTPSGRQFSKITAVDDGADTVTVEDSFNISAGSPVNYGIGGKRLTLDNADSRTLFGATGAKAGWTITLEETGSPYLLNSTINFTADGNLTTGNLIFQGNTGRVEIKWNDPADALPVMDFQGDQLIVRRLYFNRFRSTSSFAGFCVEAEHGGSDEVIFDDCKFACTGGQVRAAGTRALSLSANTFSRVVVMNCTFQDAEVGLGRTSGTGDYAGTVVNCRFVGNTTQVMIQSGHWYLSQNLIVNGVGSGAGILVQALSGGCFLAVIGNTIHDHDLDGIRITDGSNVQVLILNNLITGNGGWGVNYSDTEQISIHEDGNCFGSGSTANGSGTVTGFTQGSRSFSANPGYVNAAGGNFTPTGGVLAKGLPYGGVQFIGGAGGATYSYVDTGAAQRADTDIASGWGASLPVGFR